MVKRSEEDNLDKARRRVQLILTATKTSMEIMWPTLTSYVQEKFKLFDKQDWRDFAQTALETTYTEYQALDGYYLPPVEVHAIQEELDKFAEIFPPWFKENFNNAKNSEEKN